MAWSRLQCAECMCYPKNPVQADHAYALHSCHAMPEKAEVPNMYSLTVLNGTANGMMIHANQLRCNQYGG